MKPLDIDIDTDTSPCSGTIQKTVSKGWNKILPKHAKGTIQKYKFLSYM